MAKRKQIAFDGESGGKADFVRAMPCVVAEYSRYVQAAPCEVHTEAAHVRSRAAGGTAEDLIPLCLKHHTEQHTAGRVTFEGRYILCLRMAADLYESLYQRARTLDSAVNEPDQRTGEKL